MDFEKDYDHVDWAFLEDNLLMMRFLESWIRRMATLYRSTHSQVLLAGRRGDRSSISRSMRHSFPLTPTLSFFFAEAIRSFLTAQDMGLQSLCTLVTKEEL